MGFRLRFAHGGRGRCCGLGALAARRAQCAPRRTTLRGSVAADPPALVDGHGPIRPPRPAVVPPRRRPMTTADPAASRGSSRRCRGQSPTRSTDGTTASHPPARAPGGRSLRAARHPRRRLHPLSVADAPAASTPPTPRAAGASDTLTVTPELRLQSDWARHAATLTLRGSYDKDFTDGVARPAVGLGRRHRPHRPQPGWNIGARRRLRLFAAGAFPTRTSRPASISRRASTTSPARRRSTAASAARSSRWKARPTAPSTRTAPPAAPWSTRATAPTRVFGGRAARSATSAAGAHAVRRGRGRRGASYDQHRRQQRPAASSVPPGGRVGVAFDRGPILTGEMAVGYGDRDLRRRGAGGAPRAHRRRLAGLVADRL